MREVSEKIIIDNRTDKQMKDVLPYVQSVIRMGRISGNDTSYCYVSRFHDDVVVSAERNKASDTFVVWSIEEDKP